MERRLVGDRTADDGGPVGLVADGQAVEPGGPVRVEVPCEPDLVASRLGAMRVAGCVVRSFRSSCVLPAGAPVGSTDLSHWGHRGGGCDERASPHVMSGVMICQATSGSRVLFATRARVERPARTRPSVGGPGRARAGRARRRGGRRPGGCSRRASRRCSWCGFAPWSATPMSSRAMSGPSRSLRRRRRTSSSRSLSGSIRGCRRARGASAVTTAARSRRDDARRDPLRRGQLQQRRHRRPLVQEDADVALGLGESERPLERRRRAAAIAAARGGRAPGRRGSR